MSIADRLSRAAGPRQPETPSVFVPRKEALANLPKEDQLVLSEQARAVGRVRVLNRQSQSRAYEAAGYETPERAERARDGIAQERLSHNDGHVRARVRAPMQLHAAAVNRLARAMADASGQKPKQDELPEPPHIPTRLDKALDTEDGAILRWALSRYVEDCILINMRSTGAESGKVDGAQSDGSRIPFNETQRYALARLAIVHGKISGSTRRTLKTFASMMAPLESDDAPSMAEFANQETGITGHREQESCFVGLIWMLGKQLYEIYRSKDFPEKIEIDSRG
jgi:hypothetical protein